MKITKNRKKLLKPTIFLDRDGTLIKEKHYLSDPKDVDIEHGVVEGLLQLKRLGFQFIVITNQSGIGRGYFTEVQYQAVKKTMHQAFKDVGITFEGEYFCPHHPTKGKGEYKLNCECRKPGTKLIEQAIVEHNVDIKNSYMVGDKWADVLVGIRAGLTPVHVQTGHDSSSFIYDELAQQEVEQPFVYSASDFLAVTHHILALNKRLADTNEKPGRNLDSLNVLMVSNGYGEDTIGATCSEAIQKALPNVELSAAPLVGEGKAYVSRETSCLFTNPMMPSGGFNRTAFDIAKDIFSGLFRLIFQQKRQLKQQTADIVVAVGDVFCLWMASHVKHKHLVFLPTAKSHKFMKHSWLERHIMKRSASLIYTRDAQTAHELSLFGLPAYYLGNPMMDGLDPKGIKFSQQTGTPFVCLLPGSRDEAYKNFQRMLQVIEKALSSNKSLAAFGFLVAVSPNLERSEFQRMLQSSGLNEERFRFTSEFVDAVSAASCVIGLAGTANEQAVWMGKPVICFKGLGPQSTRQRFLEQKKLLGEHLHFIDEAQVQTIGERVGQLLERFKPVPDATMGADQEQPRVSGQTSSATAQTSLGEVQMPSAELIAQHMLNRLQIF